MDNWWRQKQKLQRERKNREKKKDEEMKKIEEEKEKLKNEKMDFMENWREERESSFVADRGSRLREIREQRKQLKERKMEEAVKRQDAEKVKRKLCLTHINL